MGKFAKNQTVYKVSQFGAFGSKAGTAENRVVGYKDRDGRDIETYVVIERQIDACGQKQMSFYNRGGVDSIFGRSERADNPDYFATVDQAFAYADEKGGVVALKVYSDANRECFNEFRNRTMKFR